MAAPTHTSSAGVHVLDWPEYHIRIRIDRLRTEHENLTGEIAVKTTNPGVAQHLHQARFNLTSTTARKTLAKALQERLDLAWDDMIEQACVMVLTKHREGEPVIRVGNLPPREALKYRVEPLLLNNQPTIIYGPGGTGKSFFALYLAVLIGGAWNHNRLTTEPGKVMLLDYETDQYEVDERIKAIVAGLGVEKLPEIFYRFCAGPLTHEVEDIQAFVTENQIDVVIVDPLGGAVGADMNDSEPILAYFGALRSLRTLTGLSVTSLSIDHTNKEGRLFGCYSSDTEVLTKRGWVLHTDLQEGEEVAAFDPRALALHWELPSRFWDYEYAGDMIEICHESTNALVTPNHRMVVKARVGDEGYASHWDMVEAERLLANRWTVVSHAPLNRTLRPQYQLTIGRRERRRLMISAESGTIRQVPYSGHVYCLSVPSGSYVTRRLGKVAFHGNSEYKTHRARSVFEAKKQQDSGADFLDFGLYHRKMNNGKLLPPRGYRLEFSEGSVVFTEKNVRDVPDLAKAMHIKDQIRDMLARQGKTTVKDLAESLERTEQVTRNTLNDNKHLFGRFGEEWGLLAREGSN